MNILGPADITIQRDSGEHISQPGLSVDMSQLLLTYRRQGTVDGVPVQDNARQLLVRSQQQLRKALRIQQQLYTFLQWISPDTPQQIRLQYDTIQQKALKGQYSIIQQIKQYDPAKSAFIVFVKYAKLTYTLNPRFEHLLQSSII